MPTTIQTDQLLVSRRKAAELLSTSERNLYTLTKRGDIPVINLGKRGVRYAVKHLEEFIDRQRHK